MHNDQQVVERIKAYPNETQLLVIDDLGDKWYKERNVVIKGTQANVIKNKTPERSAINNNDLVLTNGDQKSSISEEEDTSCQKDVEPASLESESGTPEVTVVTVTNGSVHSESDRFMTQNDHPEDKINEPKVSPEPPAVFSIVSVDPEPRVATCGDLQDVVDSEVDIEVPSSISSMSIIEVNGVRPKTNGVSTPNGQEMSEEESLSCRKRGNSAGSHSSVSVTSIPASPISMKSSTSSNGGMPLNHSINGIRDVKKVDSPDRMNGDASSEVSSAGPDSGSFELNLNMTAAQMRQLLAQKKKHDPKKVQMDLKQKYEIIQQM